MGYYTNTTVLQAENLSEVKEKLKTNYGIYDITVVNFRFVNLSEKQQSP